MNHELQFITEPRFDQGASLDRRNTFSGKKDRVHQFLLICVRLIAPTYMLCQNARSAQFFKNFLSYLPEKWMNSLAIPTKALYNDTKVVRSGGEW